MLRTKSLQFLDSINDVAREPSTKKEILEALDSKKGIPNNNHTIQKLNFLITGGYVTVAPDKSPSEDKRIKRYVVSDKGKKLLTPTMTSDTVTVTAQKSEPKARVKAKSKVKADKAETTPVMTMDV